MRSRRMLINGLVAYFFLAIGTIQMCGVSQETLGLQLASYKDALGTYTPAYIDKMYAEMHKALHEIRTKIQKAPPAPDPIISSARLIEEATAVPPGLIKKAVEHTVQKILVLEKAAKACHRKGGANSWRSSKDFLEAVEMQACESFHSVQEEFQYILHTDATIRINLAVLQEFTSSQ
ncbi:uncharacterized protein NEMAJ01_1213 [Nematocida major]|uniref:uncharacterized protein n=1 Tax=Nematocida major TaxID=1912982 RepID=UPI002007650E|nr:uncharacterized protein NEMAJ01_1213 [Nematocida major]KAH9386317.1 hypothetical protein NEMAJ01_1213 [Nematocida major]